MNRSMITLAALLIAAATVPAQGRFPGGPGPGFGPWAESRTPVTGAPYSAVRTTVVQQVLANGNQIVRQEQAKVYRDGQGRERVEQTSINPATSQTRTSVSISDPVGGAAYTLNPEAKTYVRMPTRAFAGQAGRPGFTAGAGRGRTGTMAQPGPAGRARGGAQTQTEDLGTQTIEGQAATGRRLTETIPAGRIGNQQPIQVVRETWVSTTLQVPIMIKASDPRFGTTTVQLTNVVAAEPDSTLFQPPSDYTEAGGRVGARMNARRPPAQ